LTKALKNWQAAEQIDNGHADFLVLKALVNELDDGLGVRGQLDVFKRIGHAQFHHFHNVGVAASVEVKGRQVGHRNEAKLFGGFQQARRGHEDVCLQVNGVELILGDSDRIIKERADGQVISGEVVVRFAGDSP